MYRPTIACTVHGHGVCMQSLAVNASNLDYFLKVNRNYGEVYALFNVIYAYIIHAVIANYGISLSSVYLYVCVF